MPIETVSPLAQSSMIAAAAVQGAVVVLLLAAWHRAGSQRSVVTDTLFLLITIYSCWSFLGYVAMSADRLWLPVNGRQWFLGRYIVIWLYAPLQLVAMAVASRASWRVSVKLAALGFFFTTCAALCASSDGDPPSKWIFFTLLGVIEVYTLFQIAAPRGWLKRAQQSLPEARRRALSNTTLVILVCWIAYPINWIFGEVTHTSSLETLTIIFALIDITMRTLPAWFLLRGEAAAAEGEDAAAAS